MWFSTRLVGGAVLAGGMLLACSLLLAQVPGEVDLHLLSSLNDVSRIPTEGKNLIIVAAVNNVLHFRIFGGDAKVVVDTDEKRLTGQAQQIKDLRKQLESLWSSHLRLPHFLTSSEKGRVIAAVTSIVGYTIPTVSPAELEEAVLQKQTIGLVKNGYLLVIAPSSRAGTRLNGPFYKNQMQDAQISRELDLSGYEGKVITLKWQVPQGPPVKPPFYGAAVVEEVSPSIAVLLIRQARSADRK